MQIHNSWPTERYTGRYTKYANLDANTPIVIYCNDDFLREVPREQFPPDFPVGTMFLYEDTLTGEFIRRTQPLCRHRPLLQGFTLRQNDRAPDRLIFCRAWLSTLNEIPQMDELLERTDIEGQSLEFFTEDTLSGVAAHEMLHTVYGRQRMGSPSCMIYSL